MWSPNLSLDPLPSVALFRRTELRPDLFAAPVRVQEGPSLRGQSLLQLGFSRDDGALISETLQGLGARNVARSEQVYPLGLGKPGALRYDGLVVNLDRFADVDMGVERLMRFRRAAPSCFIVMASAGVAQDDFGHHRRAICDSTLRLPLTATRLTAAIAAALTNHGGTRA